jgi:hypothetical protein
MAKAFNGFLAIPYTLPPIQEYMSNFSRQVVSLYDTVDYADDIIENGYRERYFIAGHVLDTVTETSFDFNQTYGQGNETIGLVIIDPKSNMRCYCRSADQLKQNQQKLEHYSQRPAL